jgi:hypothetical protein
MEITMTHRLALPVLLTLLAASAAEAQSEPRQWGAAISFAPGWKVPTGSNVLAKLAEFSFDNGDLGMAIKGSDLRISLVRGQPLGGEWGVSFVRRSFKDDSTQGAIVQECQQSGPTPFCFSYGTEYFYRDVALAGVEINKFISFVTIKNTVQIGLDIAGGVGAMQGTADRREVESTFVGNTQVFQVVTSSVDAKTLLAYSPALLGRVELAVAGIIPGGLKVRVSGGMNYPGQHTASFTVMYFFGRK